MAAFTAVDDSEAYFQTQLYTGNYDTNAITLDGDTDMQVDWVISKDRSDASSLIVADAARGVNRTNYIDSDSAEQTDTDVVTAFNSDGFSLGSNGNANSDTKLFVAWCWKETADAGFDIVGYTGTGSSRDISHNLSAVPKTIFTKRTNDTQNWFVYTSTGGSQKAIYLDTDGAEGTQAAAYDAAPTSSVINYGSDNAVNGSSDTYVAYLWRSVQGFSKFGGYTGNGNADGAYVHLGFRASWILIKQRDASRAWNMDDNRRVLFRAPSTGYGYNTGVDMRLYANTAGDEENYASLDILSNGFKIRTNNAYLNGSANTYVYMAFAEAPFVNSNGVPCNAR